MDIIGTALIQCTDPSEKICDIPDIFNRVNPLLAKAKTGTMPTFSLMCLMKNWLYFQLPQKILVTYAKMRYFTHNDPDKY
jgi:hypothetical protein